MSGRINRRQLLIGGAAGSVGILAGFSAVRSAQNESDLPPTRTITHGPKYHWFGYYDKLEFDPTTRYVLGMEIDFEHRAPRPDDVIRIGMVDLQDSDSWIELGQSSAWCWQQGCMLQWIPGSQSEILWNDREDGQYVCRILDVISRQLRTIPYPIYAISPDGKTAIAPDFRRLADTRPGYGYNGIADPNADQLTPKDTGIFLVDLVTGNQEMLFSIADVVEIGTPHPTSFDTKHWFNHLLFNPDGSRFVFLHRWQVGTGRMTRMITANSDGTDLRVVDDNGLTSHFIWRDPHHILAFSKQLSHGVGFYLFEDGGEKTIEIVGKDVMTSDGHCTYLPGNQWILCDTYPDGDYMQHPYLYHVGSGKYVALGHFRSPADYSGEWRCDTHPRFSRDGKTVVIDSPHPGNGRQLHLIDISGIVS
jgi:hypothetical protein